MADTQILKGGGTAGLVKVKAVDLGDGTFAEQVSTVPTASEVHLGSIGVEGDVYDVTLAMEAAANHAGDVLSDTIEIPNAVRVNGGKGIVGPIVVFDEDDQGKGLTLVFFKTNVSLGTKNAAPNISDANAREILGFVKIVAADYIDLGGVRVAFPAIKLVKVKAATASRSVFVSAILDEGGTYTASGIRLKVDIEWD